MILKEYLNKGGQLFAVDMVNNIVTLYGDERPTWLEDDMLDTYSRYIRANLSKREVYADSDDIEDIEEEVQERTELLFIANYLKYQHLHDLFTMEYNPIWNVDGTEKTTRNLTDNKTSSGSNNSTLTHNTTDTTSGTNTLTHNTQSQLMHNITDLATDTDGRTTYNSNTFFDTDKTTENHTKTGTETTTVTGTDGTQTTGSTAKTGTESTQGTTSGTDAQTVNETIMHTRGGNIGVTSTQDLATQEVNYAELINFIKIVCTDIVRDICLGV